MRSVVADEASCLDAIRRSWAKTLPDLPFDADMTWEQTGADSLKSLVFALRLEKHMGRPVPLELIDGEMTASDLAHSLCTILAASDDAVHAFLAPGIFGDEPRLAAFRRAMSPQVSFTTLRLPKLHEPRRLLEDVALSANQIAEQINGFQSVGDLILVGYSFGGPIVLEAAAQLRAAGRQVRLVCIIDSQLARTVSVSPKADSAQAATRLNSSTAAALIAPDRAWPKPGENLIDYVARIILGGLLRLQAPSLAQFVALAVYPVSRLEQRIERRKQVLGWLRVRAVGRWRPSAYQNRVLLIASDTLLPFPDIAAWRTLCPHLEVIHVGGRHLEMFEPETMARIRPALIQAMTARDA